MVPIVIRFGNRHILIENALHSLEILEKLRSLVGSTFLLGTSFPHSEKFKMNEEVDNLLSKKVRETPPKDFKMKSPSSMGITVLRVHFHGH